jgi:hypothetical protein
MHVGARESCEMHLTHGVNDMRLSHADAHEETSGRSAASPQQVMPPAPRTSPKNVCLQASAITRILIGHPFVCALIWCIAVP